MSPPVAFFGIESTGLTVAIDLFIVCCVAVYAALVWWTYADARRRIEDPTLVGAALAGSLIPFVGTLVYLILRPPESLADAHERDIEAETARLQLYELEARLCPHCDYPVQSDYIRCPSCLRRLKERCSSCERPLERAWTICPYCEAEVPPRPARPSRSGEGRRSARRKDTQRDAGNDAAPAADGARERAAAAEEVGERAATVAGAATKGRTLASDPATDPALPVRGAKERRPVAAATRKRPTGAADR
jgi:hypothetical protein